MGKKEKKKTDHLISILFYFPPPHVAGEHTYFGVSSLSDICIPKLSGSFQDKLDTNPSLYFLNPCTPHWSLGDTAVGDFDKRDSEAFAASPPPHDSISPLSSPFSFLSSCLQV
jgi:hypothetical protein